MYAYMYVCMYVCMNLYIYVCLCVCTYVCVYGTDISNVPTYKNTFIDPYTQGF